MAKSIMVTEKGRCFICRRHTTTEEHHIFEGANRKASEKFGLKIHVCRCCHHNIHMNPKEYAYLKASAQYRAMYVYGWTVDDFRALFRKSYIAKESQRTDLQSNGVDMQTYD